MIPALAWGFLAGVIGGIVSGIAVQWFGHRIRLFVDRRALRADAMMDITIGLEQLEDACQKPGAAQQQHLALELLQADLAAFRHQIGPGLHRVLRGLLQEFREAETIEQKRSLVRLALRQLAA